MYHHVHFYVKALNTLEHYKGLEKQFNSFLTDFNKTDKAVEKGKAAWTAVSKAAMPEFCSQKQDLVEQLISGLGWRITANYHGPETVTLLITSPDKTGTRFVVTAPTPKAQGKKQKVVEEFDHFTKQHLDRFFDEHSGHEGCAVLGFKAEPGHCAKILHKYQEKHPKLLVDQKGIHEYTTKSGKFLVLEVFAYYSSKSPSEADPGTVLRFVEPVGDGAVVLPGMAPVDAEFVLSTEAAAYFDHWVSNVVDRKQFLQTLEDTLGFVPKVDFNAGVVAAGEAIIESTVTGNTPAVVINSKAEGLVNQEQVYLPINNALSTVGHVHGYLEQIGQGIQHLASRVEDLVGFISRVNLMRETTGQGFTFLNIPMSYYGRLEAGDLAAVGLTKPASEELFAALTQAKLVSLTGIVPVNITDAQTEAVFATLTSESKDCVVANKEKVLAAVRKGIYCNMWGLLKDNFSEETYLSIVRNKVLVDIQGADVLFQIFTAPVLQQKPADEAPFLEFIQRVCSEAKDVNGNARAIKPGCGGFGIRNFLTLFLSIEVSKAMMELEKAIESKQEKSINLAHRKVKAFTDQLDESNPVLTEISDAMTAEGDARAELAVAPTADQPRIQALVDSAEKAKTGGNDKLQLISDRYKALLGSLRDEATALAK